MDPEKGRLAEELKAKTDLEGFFRLKKVRLFVPIKNVVTHDLDDPTKYGFARKKFHFFAFLSSPPGSDLNRAGAFAIFNLRRNNLFAQEVRCFLFMSMVVEKNVTFIKNS